MTPTRRGTPTTSFRLDPALLARAKARAVERGETLTDVVRRALESEHVTLTLTGGDTLNGAARWTCPCGAVNLVPIPRESGPVTLRCAEEEK